MRFQHLMGEEVAPLLFPPKKQKYPLSLRYLRSKEIEAYLKSLAVGDGGLILVEEGERRDTVRRQLQNCARRLRMIVRIRCAGKDRIAFRFEGWEEEPHE